MHFVSETAGEDDTGRKPDATRALAGGGGSRANQERGKEREGTPLVTSARPLHQLRPWITGFIWCVELGNV
ncbi:hypothetical protein Pcinc_019066 [Petrolisthes cinctipes]|uniref:Uncharacterized protein n=1 Tax=Petrolisthes cinctipes TaxID=88211 RepID=A0AAE1FMZ3_PETCI|nr:hypothetical protein Pcinc_019066 [Petrolisthes cinctipes]